MKRSGLGAKEVFVKTPPGRVAPQRKKPRARGPAAFEFGGGDGQKQWLIKKTN